MNTHPTQIDAGPGRRYLVLCPAGPNGALPRFLAECEDRGTLIEDRMLVTYAPALWIDPAARRAALQDAGVLQGLANPAICPPREVVALEDGGLAAMVRFTPGRDMHDLLNADDRWSPRAIVQVVRDVARVVGQVDATRPLAARDVAPGNVWVGPDARVSLLAFGVRKALRPEPEILEQVAAEASYVPPEWLREGSWHPFGVTFTLGLLLHEAWSPPLFGDLSVPSLFDLARRCSDYEDFVWDRIPRDLPPSARRLLLECLTWDPNDRAPLAQVVAGCAHLLAELDVAGQASLNDHCRQDAAWLSAAYVVSHQRGSGRSDWPVSLVSHDDADGRATEPLRRSGVDRPAESWPEPASPASDGTSVGALVGRIVVGALLGVAAALLLGALQLWG